jgi:hypothetical protein
MGFQYIMLRRECMWMAPTSDASCGRCGLVHLGVVVLAIGRIAAKAAAGGNGVPVFE